MSLQEIANECWKGRWVAVVAGLPSYSVTFEEPESLVVKIEVPAGEVYTIDTLMAGTRPRYSATVVGHESSPEGVYDSTYGEATEVALRDWFVAFENSL